MFHSEGGRHLIGEYIDLCMEKLRWHRRLCLVEALGVVPGREKADAIVTRDDLLDLGLIQAGKGNEAGTGREDDAADLGRGEVGHPGADVVEELVGPVEAQVRVPR